MSIYFAPEELAIQFQGHLAAIQGQQPVGFVVPKEWLKFLGHCVCLNNELMAKFRNRKERTHPPPPHDILTKRGFILFGNTEQASGFHAIRDPLLRELVNPTPSYLSFAMLI